MSYHTGGTDTASTAKYQVNLGEHTRDRMIPKVLIFRVCNQYNDKQRIEGHPIHPSHFMWRLHIDNDDAWLHDDADG
jgi:hypothetical protein